MQIFKDSQGNYSSKRTLGVIYMLIALLMAVIDQLTKFEINSFEVWITIVITGGSLLGITLFEGKNINSNKQSNLDHVGNRPDDR